MIGGTATLSVYAIAITAYSVSAIRFPRWERWLFVTAMLLILFIGLGACLSLGSDILRHARRPHVPSVRRRRLWLAAPVLASSFLSLTLTMTFAGGWIFLRFLRSGDGILTGFRAVNLNNGVSPLPPLFFIALATVTWAFCSICRLQMIEGIASISSIPVPGSAQNTEQIRRDSSFFYSNKYSFRGLSVLELQIYDLLSCPSLRFPQLSNGRLSRPRPDAFLGWLPLFLSSCLRVRIKILLSAIGNRLPTRLCGCSCQRAPSLLSLEGPARAAPAIRQASYAPSFLEVSPRASHMPRMNLATAPTSLTALGVSISQARDLLNSVQELPSAQNKEHAEIVALGKDIIAEAKSRYECALEAVATGQYRSSLTEQIEVQRLLNRFTRRVESALEMSWGMSVSYPEGKEGGKGAPDVLWCWFHSDRRDKENIETARKAITEQAEKFIVSRTVHFLAHVLPQLTNLTTYSLVCLFLMLLAVSSYPLQPKNPFAYYNWFVILAFIGVSVHMAVQMNRDAVLSCLNGTKPREIHWDAEFIKVRA